MKKWLLLCSVLALMLAVTATLGWRWLNQPGNATAAVRYELPRGASVMRIADELQAAGWLEHPRIWAWWARLRGESTRIRAGEYALQPGMTPVQLLQLFVSGDVVVRSITIVEGTTFRELRRQLARNDSLDPVARALPDDQLMARLGLEGQHPEGWFFPDTYQYSRNSSDLDILRMASTRMQRELELAWQQRASDLQLASPYEVLILASIVEKETALGSERPMIAGVFAERLSKGMMLQTDPTVIYGLGERFDGNLRKRDLQTDGPYNTYTRTGLPPTPIALPGAEALHAAANPQRTGALYFVATGKGDGSHYFSKTYQEHSAAVRRYLAALRARKTS